MQTQNQLPISVPHDSIKQFPPIDRNKKRKQDIKWLILEFLFSEKEVQVLNFISLLPILGSMFLLLLSASSTVSSSKANDTEKKKPRKKEQGEKETRKKLKSLPMVNNMHDDDDRCVRKCRVSRRNEKYVMMAMILRSQERYTWIRCFFERKSPWVYLCLHICFVLMLSRNFDGPCFISPLYFSRIRLLHHHRKKEKFPVHREVPLILETRPNKSQSHHDRSEDAFVAPVARTHRYVSPMISIN